MMRLYKLYAWSVALEPLLFFTGLGATVGIGVSLARGLQLTVIILYLAAPLFSSEHSTDDPFFKSSLSTLKKHYWAFLLVSLVGSSIIFGFNQLTHNPFFKVMPLTGETAILRSAYVRPFFEIVIYLYYFWYFVILPHRIFKNIEHVKYFFKTFSFIFILNLILGYVDFFGTLAHLKLIPRHLFEIFTDRIVFVGDRFHGLAGEPRDAFVYLVLGLAIYFLSDTLFKRKINYLYVSVIMLALVLTRSASGVFGIVLFILLVLIMGASYGYLKIRHVFLIVVLSVLMIMVSLRVSERLMEYLTSIQSLFHDLQISRFSENLEFSYLVRCQLVNIAPILHILSELATWNFLPVLFGHGIGTNSMINNFILTKIGWPSELFNSHTHVVRLLYEFGIIGTYLFILSMIRPLAILSGRVRNMGINAKLVIVSMLAVLGCGLAHKSAAPFIFLGIAHVSLLMLKTDTLPK